MNSKKLALWIALAIPLAAQANQITGKVIGRYVTDGALVGGAEIPAYDPATKRLYVVTPAQGGGHPWISPTPQSPPVGRPDPRSALAGSVPNSVAVHSGLIAVAVEAAVKTDPGQIQVYNSEGRLLRAFPAGALPDRSPSRPTA